MRIEYDSKKTEKLFYNFNNIIQKVGLELAQKIKLRFNQIEAANNFQEYLTNGIGNPHHLTGKLKKCYGVSLNKNYRLIVEPKTKNFDLKSLEQCHNIIVKGVIDYHGQKYEWLIP